MWSKRSFLLFYILILYIFGAVVNETCEIIFKKENISKKSLQILGIEFFYGMLGNYVVDKVNYYRLGTTI